MNRKIDMKHRIPRIDLIDSGAVLASTQHALRAVLENEPVDYGTLVIAFSVDEDQDATVHVTATTRDEAAMHTTDGETVLDRLRSALRDAAARERDHQGVLATISRAEHDLGTRRNRLLDEVDSWPWWARARAVAVRRILIGGDE